MGSAKKKKKKQTQNGVDSQHQARLQGQHLPRPIVGESLSPGEQQRALPLTGAGSQEEEGRTGPSMTAHSSQIAQRRARNYMD